MTTRVLCIGGQCLMVAKLCEIITHKMETHLQYISSTYLPSAMLWCGSEPKLQGTGLVAGSNISCQPAVRRFWNDYIMSSYKPREQGDEKQLRSFMQGFDKSEWKVEFSPIVVLQKNEKWGGKRQNLSYCLLQHTQWMKGRNPIDVSGTDRRIRMKPAYAAMNAMVRVSVFLIVNLIFLFPIFQFNFPAPVLINQSHPVIGK